MSKYVLSDLFIGDFPITQKYGENPKSYPMFTIPGHEGVDWGTPNGTTIVSPFNGIILRDTFNDKDYGNFTVVWDPIQHCAVWFCHLLDVTTKPGDKVTTRQVLGHTNNTGNSTGPHLHINLVETDANANRLNTSNGKQGFLNILDPNLVEWKLATQSVPQPVPTPPQDTWIITDQTKIPQIGNQEVQAINSQLNDLQRDLKNCQSQPLPTLSSYSTSELFSELTKRILGR